MLSAHLGADVLNNNPLCLFTLGVGTTKASADVFFPLYPTRQYSYIKGT